jgi:hypothetical protein
LKNKGTTGQQNHNAAEAPEGKRKGSDSDLSKEPAGRVSFMLGGLPGNRSGGVMVDWGRVLAATGGALQGISDAAVVSKWLEKDDEDAYIAVVTQVSTSSTDEVDRLDAALLSLAASNFSADTRRRLIKFYAVFKIAEMRRYQVFRGFPQ